MPGEPSRRRFLLGASAALGALAMPACRSRSMPPTPASAEPTPPARSPSPTDVWEPSSTWLFFVGILDFQHPKVFPSFPQEGRRDVELYERLLARGVPASQAVFLRDGDASLAKIESALAAHVKKPQPGDTLWLYYAGHGSPDASGVAFAAWDGDERDESGWPVRRIVDAIERGFRGDRVVLTADACYSGALAQEAANRRSRIGYASLTSSMSREVSTGSWTYTECLLAALSGDAQLDLNDDGVIRLDEVARYTESEMAFVEGQLSTFAAVRFPAGLVLSRCTRARDPRIGEHVEVQDGDTWSPAKVVEAKGDAVRVRYVDGDEDDDTDASGGGDGGAGRDAGDTTDAREAWSPRSRTRPYVPKRFAVGARVEVEWEGKWYESKVLGERLGIHLIHYVEDDESWDEWVGPSRIRPES